MTDPILSQAPNKKQAVLPPSPPRTTAGRAGGEVLPPSPFGRGAGGEVPPYGTREYYQAMGRRGGQARAKMPDFKQHQSAAGKASAAVNDMAALGSLGAKAFIRKYGYIKFFNFWRNWKLLHPSSHERQIMDLLAGLDYVYEREAMVLGDNIPLAVDFYIPDANDAVIEVLGRVHFDPRFDHPNYELTRRGLDMHRLRRLERAGFRVLELDYRLLPNTPLLTAKIVGFLISAPERR